MKIAAIITAAGRGTRAGGDLPKQWQILAGEPVVAHALRAFSGMERVLVIHPDDHARAQDLHRRVGDFKSVVGGETRALSVRAALEALALNPPDLVLIHDGARPFPSSQVIDAVLTALRHAPAAAPALPVSDALWIAKAGQVVGLQDRSALHRAQTPQGFQFSAILAAHRAYGAEAADDVEIARAFGLDVVITKGDEDNLKLTYPDDFARAAAILQGRKASNPMDIRTGNGFDVHAFTQGSQVWLCGVSVPHSRGLLGHSDADVGMHALTDAIYGALAEGDIGQHFPPSDPQWKGAASHVFLEHAVQRVKARGFRLTHCDVTLICERPKIGPHAEAMRSALAGILQIDMERVSVKATTSERLGFTGREEGIAAMATATLVAQ